MTNVRRILLVEDDAHIADLLSLHLRDEGLEVVHCARGDDGLAHLERGGWDALVLDLMLPGVDGLEICRRARAMTRYTPIIIISARSIGSCNVQAVLETLGNGGGNGATAGAQIKGKPLQEVLKELIAAIDAFYS